MKVFDAVLTTVVIAVVLTMVGCGEFNKSVGKVGDVKIVKGDEGFEIFDGGNKVLFYRLKPKNLDGKLERLNYIHPLYNLDGDIITEDFPPDHPHQRGIFWAWHQIYIGDRRVGDSWSLKNFSQEVLSACIIEKKKDSATVKTQVVWKSPLWTDKQGNEKPFVKVTTVVRVHKAQDDIRKIDFVISLLALEENVRIGGSENIKGYGGFSARIKLKDDFIFTGQEGVIEPQNSQVEAGGWVDISGRYSPSDRISGLAVLCHKNNPSYPTAWILRRKGSMQNAVYPGQEPAILSNKQPTVLRYRLILHGGDVTQVDLNKELENYAKAVD